jgi:putative redox protein
LDIAAHRDDNRRTMTSSTDQPTASEVLVAAVRLESGEAPHAQRISIGHHTIAADEPTSHGGGDTGPSPTGLLLAALASCTSITLRMYADRKGWALGSIHVDAKLLRAGDAQRVERTIRFGAPPPPDQLARLAEIAEKTPVTKMVSAGVPMTTHVK